MKGTEKRNRRSSTLYQLSTTDKWMGQYVEDGKRKCITGESKEEVRNRLLGIIQERRGTI